MTNALIMLEMNQMQDKSMETSMTTIKSNVVSLGNYINNINRLVIEFAAGNFREFPAGKKREFREFFHKFFF